MNNFKRQVLIVVATGLALLLMGITLRAVADPLVETPTAQKKSPSKEKLKELRHGDRINRLNRDQQLSAFQGQLDEQKRNFALHSRPEPQLVLNQLQRRLDGIKIDQQLRQVQTELQLDQIDREQSLWRQQEGVRELQRQQRLDFLQDQQRKLQVGNTLDGLRNRQSIQ